MKNITKKDIIWVKKTIAGRHTGGPNVWWKQNKEKLGFNDFIKLVLVVWEAGRNPPKIVKFKNNNKSNLDKSNFRDKGIINKDVKYEYTPQWYGQTSGFERQ